MKKYLKNRTFAIGLTVLIIIAGTLFGSHRSLEAEAYPAERYFVDGSDGYSIQRELDNRTGLASNLLTVGSRYLVSGDQACAELENAIREMDEAKTVSEKAKANQKLTAATEHMDLVLDEEMLSRSDERYRQQIRADLMAANQNIGRSDYNELAYHYNTEVLGKFPANILAKMTGVEELETFQMSVGGQDNSDSDYEHHGQGHNGRGYHGGSDH